MADLVEDILPPRRVHLLGGESDAGKTRFIIPALKEWEKGGLFLGKPGHPVPWAYVIGDRLLEEAHDTVRDMGFEPSSIPMIPAFGPDNKNWPQIVRAVAELKPIPSLLVIEGFGELVDDPPTRKRVRNFLSDVSSYCGPGTELPEGMTVLGIVESPKMKPSERYANPRQRISGVSAWGYHTSTVMLIENEDPEGLSAERTIWVCMKNAKRLKIAARFGSDNRLKDVLDDEPTTPAWLRKS